MDSSSSSGDETDPFEAIAKRVEGEEAEIDAVGVASEEKTAAAEDVSAEEAAALDASSEEKVAVAEDSTDGDAVSMDELEAAEASFDDVSTASASNPKSIERAVEKHVVVGGVTSAVRTVETTPVSITSSGGVAQGNPSRSESRTDPSLLDLSPSTLHYVRRVRRGSMLSTDSERTISATTRAPTPPSPLQESSGIASTPLVILAVVSASAFVQRDEAAPVVAEVVPSSEEILVHIFDVPEGNTIGDTPANEDIVVDTDLGMGVTQIGHGEAVASADPDLAGVTLDSDIPDMEGTVRTTTRGSNGPQNVTQLTMDQPSRFEGRLYM